MLPVTLNIIRFAWPRNENSQTVWFQSTLSSWSTETEELIDNENVFKRNIFNINIQI